MTTATSRSTRYKGAESVVKSVTTHYCETCNMGYSSYQDAIFCEQSPQAELEPGDVILRSARGGEGFTLESSGLVWATVSSVRMEGGRKEHPGHKHFYKTSGIRKEIGQEDLAYAAHGRLSIERGITDGPGHTRNLIYLLETFEEVRVQMAECFKLLSACAGMPELTPESYAKWDDLRYTAYDFGVIDGEGPVRLPGSSVPLLQWCTKPIPAEEVHRNLFYKPQLGLHGGPLVYAPFEDTVGTKSKWFVGQGDAYKYLRFHMQPIEKQLSELAAKQQAVLSGEEVCFDNLADLFAVNTEQSEIPAEVSKWAAERDIHGAPAEIAAELWAWLQHEQERWRETMNVAPSVIPKDIPVIAVAAGKGGVGKSTVAANIARVLAKQGKKPLFLDLDFYGPSAPAEFDLHEPLQIVGGYIIPHQKDGVRVVSVGNMIASDTALHWRGPVLEAFIHLLTAHINYDDVDMIVLDCPPGTGDVQLGMIHRIRPTSTLLVSTASELALADVRRAVASFREADIPVLGLLENMSAIALGNGEFKRLFGTKERVRAFCEEEGLAHIGSVPFVDTADELLACIKNITWTFMPHVVGGR